MSAKQVEKELRSLANPAKSKILSRFFKTGKGQYGEGDIFLGITVPVQRKVAERFRELTLIEIQKLLSNLVHECRLTALEILVMQYEHAKKEKNEVVQNRIITFYLKNTKYINNWDLVDLSASYILGDYLLNNKDAKINRKILYKLVESRNLWERRISIISTAAFIRANEFADTLKLANILLTDTHDLMHKAVGWMLREVGKKDEKVLVKFLDAHVQEMPRTMLRYAIEKFPEAKRQAYLKSSHK